MSRALVWLLAISTGCIVANIYYMQPLLADMAKDFGLSVAQIGAVAMVTQIGTGAGMLVFVPLGDKLERRRLILTLLIAAAISLVCAAMAPDVVSLAAACFAVGATAATVHVIVPLAAHLAPAHQRGRVVGSVLSGLLVGVLLARTFSGVLGAQFGWRAVYWTASACMLTLGGVLRLALPESAPELALPWVDLMRSVVTLAREQRVLRQAAVLACLLFFSFSALWTTLVFLLRTPPYDYGTTVAGAFGLLGAGSAAAAPIVGRISDRHGPNRAIAVAIAASIAGYAVLWIFGRHLAGLILAIGLVDVGVQSGHVLNQARIYSLIPSARSRLNTVYMVAFFTGGALGASCGTLAFTLGGWGGFCAVPLAALTFAFVYFLRSERDARNSSSADDSTIRRRRSG
jgi:predicted MFS family arabinose efflux permease